MTKASLERGKEIQYEIEELKTCLSIIAKANLFNTERGMGCVSRPGTEFLNVLEVDIKQGAQEKISNRIADLENEFSSL